MMTQELSEMVMIVGLLINFFAIVKVAIKIEHRLSKLETVQIIMNETLRSDIARHDSILGNNPKC